MKKQNGITLIALVITIIVMLILVGVSVTEALNGGLFNTAKTAKTNTLEERDRELDISNGDIIYEYLPKEPITWTKTSSGDLAIGSTVETSTGEEFYVIGEGQGGTAITGDSTVNVILLAKYCIVADEESDDYLKQSSTAGGVIFSNKGYWSSSSYPIDLNDTETYPIPEEINGEEVTSIITTAIEYGEKFENANITGRLMTLEEVEGLGGDSDNFSISDCITNGYGFVNSVDNVVLSYWLSTALNSSDLWAVINDYLGAPPCYARSIR